MAILNEYLRIVRKIESYPLPLEFGQKIWAEKRAESGWRPFFWVVIILKFSGPPFQKFCVSHWSETSAFTNTSGGKEARGK